MEYLLAMSFSGSTMMGIYFLLRHLLKDKVSSRFYYLIIKEAVLFFLIPLPFLKGWYREMISAIIPVGQMTGEQIAVRWTKHMVHVGGKEFVNFYYNIQAAMATVWLFIVWIMMVSLYLKYLRMRRLIIKYKGSEMTEMQWSFLSTLKKQYGVRRPVILCQGRNGDHTMTFGVFKPIIICDKEVGSWESEIHVRHEIIHIKRMDALWKMLAHLVVVLYWWNPIAWMLLRNLDCICEYSCDEILMQGKTRKEVKEYLRLLIDEACDESKTEKCSVKWQSGFADDVDNMKGRMKNLMKQKKWNCYVAGILAVTLAIGNSLTVFAYRDTVHQEVLGNTSEEEVEKTLQSDIISFIPDEVDEEAFKDFQESKQAEIIYEKQFTDIEGNIYSYSDEDMITIHRSCSHDFVSGISREHNMYSNGGCEIREYYSQRCSKCGYIIRGEEKNVITYKVCPH